MVKGSPEQRRLRQIPNCSAKNGARHTPYAHQPQDRYNRHGCGCSIHGRQSAESLHRHEHGRGALAGQYRKEGDAPCSQRPTHVPVLGPKDGGDERLRSHQQDGRIEQREAKQSGSDGCSPSHHPARVTCPHIREARRCDRIDGRTDEQKW